MTGSASSPAWRAGRWRLRGDAALFALAREGLERDAAERRAVGGPRELGGLRVHHKGSALALRPALRHGTRAALGVAEVPRLQEFHNLEWLCERGFAAVRPLLAGARHERGLPRYQFLFTELVPDAPTLAELFERGPRERREPALRALAAVVARLHALGFVHRDLFPRNVLVREGAAVECVLLDAWRGTPSGGRRPPEHDLGCLLLDGASLFTRGEQALLLAEYRAASVAAARTLPVDWEERVERARAAVHARERTRRSGLEPDWRFPS